MPQQRNGERRHGHRDWKAVHAGAQPAGVLLGHAGDQVGGARQRQRGREAVDDRDDLALESERLQRVVDGAAVETAARDGDVPALRVACGRHLALAQRMPAAHDADEAVAQQRLRAHLRTGRGRDHTGFQIHGAVAQQRAVLVELAEEAQPHAGRLLGDPRDEGGAEVLDEALAGAQRERAHQSLEVELLRGTQDRGGLLHELAHRLAQRECAGRGHETAAGPHQQRIAGGLAQARQRAAHRGRTQPQPPRGARDAALREQHVERHQQVEVGGGHPVTIARS